MQMYKSHIFDPLNFSLIREKSAYVEEKKFDFSLDSFKSKSVLTYLTCPFFNLAFVITIKVF